MSYDNIYVDNIDQKWKERDLVKLLRRLVPQSVKKHLMTSTLWGLQTKLSLRASILRHNPVGITVELTNRCNLSCTYCPKSREPNMKVGDMHLNDFKKMIDDAERYISNLRQICLVGFGEPLLYKSLFDVIQYIKGKYPTTNITITTNGLLLDEQMGARLIASGLSQMTISVNTTTEATYEQINRSKAYDLVVKNTKNFLIMLNEGQRRRKPTTFVQVLDTINNESEIAQFKEYWQPYLTPNACIQVQPFVNWAGEIDFANVRPLPTGIKTDDVVDRYPCPHLFATLNGPIVSREGLVLACCMAFPLLEEDLILGNVFESSLQDLYMGEKFRRLCDVHLRAEYGRTPACERCDAWKSYPNIWFRHPFCWHGRKWF